MGDLDITETHNNLTIQGDNNTLDVVVEQHELSIENSDGLKVETVSVGLSLKSNDINLDIVEKKVEILTIGVQGPSGPAGSGGGGTVEPQQTIFEQINDDYGYRGDAAIGVLTSEPKWQIRKIVILGDGTPDDIYVDGDDGFIHVWDDRTSFNY